MNWLRYRYIAYVLSIIAIVVAMAPVILGHLRLAIEFTGGSRLVVAVENNADIDASQVIDSINSVFAAQQKPHEAVKPRPNDQYEILFAPVSEEEKNKLVAAVGEKLGRPVQEVTFQTVGPSIGRELISKTALALVAGVVAILLYLWYQFRDWRFGLAGILAMLHDTAILVGAFSWMGWVWDVRVDVLFVTAVLTTLSFSIHDTIVIFDRMRELRLTKRITDPVALGNAAIGQTLIRSVNNSLTIIFMLLTLVLFGGESLRWFALALLVGTITGTYSSTFVAVPLYVWSKRGRV